MKIRLINKVRKEKNAFIDKLIKENKRFVKKAIQHGIEAPSFSRRELQKQAEQIKNMREAQIKESNKMHELQKEMTKEEISAYNKKIAEQNKMYWYCRGKKGKDLDDIYVAWDGKNWENNGWYHWKCIEELRFKTKEDLEDMNEWFWPSCREDKKVVFRISGEPEEGEKKTEVAETSTSIYFMLDDTTNLPYVVNPSKDKIPNNAFTSEELDKILEQC